MWQYLVVAVLVIAAAVYAARSLGPRRWRRKPGAGATVPGAHAGTGAAGQCGCGKGGDGCH